MTADRPDLKGWQAFWRRRRKALRAIGGLSLSEASNLALHEIRCRARIAEVLGRPAAKALQLRTCIPAYAYGDPGFVLIDRLDRSVWDRLAGIPELLMPIDPQPELA
jgi:hypothetical protein